MKLGLVWPASDAEDVSYYMSRRYDDECGDPETKECISVERSDAYEGLSKGLFVVIGGIDGGAERRLKRATEILPDAYIKRSEIDLGCRS